MLTLKESVVRVDRLHSPQGYRAMGRGSKFSADQQKFLSTYSEAFLAARAKRDKLPTLNICYNSFFERWPVALPADWQPTPYVPPKKKPASTDDGDEEEVEEVVSAEELEKRIEADREKVRDDSFLRLACV